MSQHFGDLEGVETDIDDIIVHAGTEMKHDCRLNSVLNRCKKINLTLHEKKCVFKVKQVKKSARGIRSQTPRNNCEEALSDSTAQTTKNSVENAKVRLHTRI